MRRHCCISDRRASNETRNAFALTRQAGARGAMILSTVGRKGYDAGGAGQG
jgi:hypothetical protein